MSNQRSMQDGRISEIRLVRELGKQIGYGNMMNLASRLWKDELRKNGGAVGGEFTVGPCRAEMVRCGCKSSNICAWCGGTGLVTIGVKNIKNEVKRRNLPFP